MYEAAAGCRSGDHGTGTEHHHVGTVLEGAAKLSGVDGQSQWFVGAGPNIDIGVLLHWRTGSAAGERPAEERELKRLSTH